MNAVPLAVAVSCAASFAAPVFAGAIPSPYVIDFFPDDTQINNTVQLVFFGPGNAPNAAVGYEITNVRLVIDFTTAGDFQAENLHLLMTANAGSTFISITGADLGWSGQGSFSEDVNFSDLNGVIGPGLWTFDLQSFEPVGDIFAYSGSFSAETRFEVSLIPSPSAIGVAGLAGALRRRRR